MSGKNLSFLSKKSWHTGTIKHMDKVWKAEQKAESEKKKIQELQKEIERERAKKELLDAKTGGTAPTGKESLEWMYRGVLSATTTEQELSKAFETQDEKEDLSTPSLLQHKPINATQDDWSKVMEDPLLDIKQKEQDTLKMIAKNPLKMQEIISKLQEQENKKRKRKSDKKRKHKKKYDSKSSRSPSPRRRRRYSERSISPRDRRRYERRDRSPSPRRTTSRRSRSPSDRYHRKYRDDRSISPRRRYSRSPDRRRASRYDRSPSPRRNRRESPSSKEDLYNRVGNRSNDRGVDSRQYSPRRRDRDNSPPYRRNKRNNRSRVSNMTEEERLKKIQEMEDAGKANYDMKLKRYMKSKQESKKDEDEPVSRNEESNFIRLVICL